MLLAFLPHIKELNASQAVADQKTELRNSFCLTPTM